MSATTGDHVMKCHLEGDGYITMTWPRKLTVRMLDHALDLVTMQLTWFRDQAQQEEDGDIEYKSWFQVEVDA